jgi:two-component system sensor histidine kinase LytS
MTLSLSLLVTLTEWIGVVATTAFLLSQTTVLQRLVKYQLNFRDKCLLALVFGLLGIISTYTGIPIQDALANSRVIGPMVAGLLGGPAVGGAAGLLAGAHRYLLGGFTAGSCAIASTLEGILGGLFRRYYQDRAIPWTVALVAGLCGETLQMLIILATARPFEAAYHLVQAIALPMIIVNPIGIAVFIVIVNTAIEQRSRIGAVQAEKALRISNQTLTHLRQGLTPSSAQATAAIIYSMNDYAAVSLINHQAILAHSGEGSDHHLPGSKPLTCSTQLALTTGIIQLAETKAAIGCHTPGCRLASAVIVPLKMGDEIIGALKLYHAVPGRISPLDMQLAAGLAQLFSTQLELAEIDRQAKMAADAEMRALQAQINPHFLFNTLNTISSLIRTQPETARDIIMKLSSFFRHTLQKADLTIPLAEELAQVEAYLAIEHARFGDKLEVIQHIDPGAQKAMIPLFTLQPLVENAVRHGLQPQEEGGTVTITTLVRGADVEIVIADNGVGIDPELKQQLGRPGYGRSSGNGIGIGLVNVCERLKGTFGKNYGLTIDSTPGVGTAMHILIPLKLPEAGETHVIL